MIINTKLRNLLRSAIRTYLSDNQLPTDLIDKSIDHDHQLHPTDTPNVIRICKAIRNTDTLSQPKED